MTSRFEYFGKVACEAIALGVPIVAYSNTGVSSYLKNDINGLEVNNYDSKNFVDAILKSQKINWNYSKVRESVINFSDNSNLNIKKILKL